jgi:hypothetical protein
MQTLRAVHPVDGEPSPLDLTQANGVEPGFLAELSHSVPGRGSAARLADIGGWGAVICDLTAVSGPDRDQLLAAASKFNIGVSLFDSMVDENSPAMTEVAAALNVGRLRGWLEDPASPNGSFPDAPVVQLFENALTSVGRHWMASPEHIRFLGDLLELMYMSELRRSDDPFAAKELPVLFLGAIGTSDPSQLDFYRRLGLFLAAWDDWLDQGDDIITRRPNIHFGSPRGFGAVSYFGRAVWRVSTGLRSLPPVTAELERRLTSATASAESLGPPISDRAHAFLTALLR